MKNEIHLAQQEIYYGQIINNKSSLYNVGGYISLKGGIETKLLIKIIQELPHKFDVFNFEFDLDKEIPQFQLKEKVDKIHVNELNFSREKNPEKTAKNWMQNQFNAAFNIYTDDLYRYTLIEIAEDEHWLFMCFHHLLVDGYSFMIKNNYIVQEYDRQKIGKEKIEDKQIPLYYDAVIRSSNYHKSEDYINDKNFWKTKYENIPNSLLNHSKKRKNTGGKRISFSIPESDRSLYEKLVKSTKVSLQQFTLASLIIYFGKSTKNDVFCFGVPIHNRGSREERKMVGMFSSVLPFKGEYDETQTLLELITTIKQTQRKDYRHRRYPISHLNRELGLMKQNRHQLYDIVVNYEPFDFLEELSSGVTVVTKHLTSVSNLEAPISIRWCDYGKNHPLELQVDYQEAYFNQEDIEGLINSLFHVLRQFEGNLNELLTSVSIVPKNQEKLLLEKFNNREVSYPSDKTVIDLFRDQIKAFPEAIALEFEGATMSYRELEERSNQLAHYLIEQGIGKETLVPICIDRSLAMVVGILGIIKAGGAYVPIDPSYPQERIDFILQDTNASLVVTHSDVLHLFKENKLVKTSVLLDQGEQILQGQSVSIPEVKISPDQLVYIIYTSGTTGTPKGVMIAHKSLNSFLCNIQDVYPINKGDKILLKTNYTFDVSVHELFGWIKGGGNLVILPNGVEKERHGILNRIEKHKITHVNVVPSMFSILLEELSTYKELKLPSLKYFHVAGEVLPANMVKKYNKLNISALVENVYGPTEATIYSTHYSTTNFEEKVDNISIGSPLPNTSVYVLSEDLSLLPIGVTGELYIGGTQLARGYLNRPDLTAERFVAHPFKKGERVYKSGDLARWLPDGTLEFIGRKDNQVKIRGYRIELGEIESIIATKESIQQSIVVAIPDNSGHKRLVAYIKTVLSDDIEHQELKRYLSEKLPDYMVPGVYVFLDDFPLTHNGKIDKKALPAPETSFSRINNYVAPTTEEEKELVSVWEELLGIAKIGVEDNFFELGGDSIKAIQLVSKSKSLDIHYQVKDIFDYQTISGICSNLQLAFDTVTEEGLLSGEVPLHPIQHYFFEQDYKASNHYNQSLILTIPKSISIDRLAVCFLQLFHHHDALRLKYDFSLEGVEQRYSNFIGKPSACSVTSLSEIPDLCNSYQSELNIKEGDLLRALLIHTPHTEKKNRLFLTIHHLAIDGISWRVLLEDLEVLLSKEAIEGSTILPAKGTSYRQWTEKLQEYAVLPSTQLEYSYWKEVLSKYRPLPVDFSSDIETTYEQTHTIQTRLSRADTTSLTQEIHHAYGTEINDILLSALSKTMEGWISSSEFVIGLEGHGREELFRDVDLSRTIGWFTSLYPVCLSVPSSGTVSYEDLISRTKDSLREIPKKGINYPILRYLSEEEIREELSLQYEDLIFNYLGDFDHYNASENSLLSISNENTGEAFGLKNQNPNKIAINSIIVQGQLEINWSYDSHRYEENTIKTLSDKFDKILRSIIHHCKVLSDREKTPGDYGLPSKISYTNLVNFKQGRERLLNSKIEDIYPLTALQQGMLFHSLYNPEDTAYLVQFHCDLAGNFSKDSFLKSWKVLMDGHSTLRSCIYANELAIPVQCVYESMELPVQMYDYTSYSAGEKEVAIQSFLEKDKQTNFDFEKEPLFRITLFKVDSDTVRMVFTNHHILWDGWSFAKLMSNFIEVYQQMVNGTELTVLSTDNYRSHIDYINSQNRTEGLAYWGRYLSGIEQATYLPFTGNVSERNKTFGNSERTLLISKEVSNQINSFAEQNHITTSTVLQGTWSYLLSKYTGISAVTFGATISGRNSDVEGIADKVGLYINTIPVCSHIESQANIVDWLQELQRGHTIGREDHGYLSLLEIEKQSVVSSPCFDTLMVFENYPIENLDSTSFDLTIKNIESKENTNYTLSLCVFDTEEGISIKLTYNNTILPDDVVVMIEKHIYQLLSSITSGVKTLGELTYLGKEEKEELLTLFNNTEVSYPSDKTVIDLFRDQVKAFPEAIALEFEGATMSYRELEERSNQLAHYLIEQGIGKETLVPICIDRSLAMVVGILGIIKAGGAYVPIDPSYPQERIDFILQDTNASLVVTHSDVLHLFKENKLVKTSVLLDQGEQILQGQSVSIPEVKISPDQLIYVIYTSGTTGTPKGVLCEHKGIMNLAVSQITEIGLNSEDRILQFASISFDAFGFELYPCLLSGAKLIIVNKDTVHSKDDIGKVISEQKITVATLPPTYQEILQDHLFSLKTIISAGEAIIISLVEKFQAQGIKVINEYGPTENSVATSMSSSPLYKGTIATIGSPLPNTSVYVLSEDLSLLPIGVTGELYIGGTQLARGYLNRPDLTAERFVAHPFKKGERVYKSGDLARWLPDGTLEFIGRKDNQVKIRGYRIELGEIESIIATKESIQQSIVVAIPDNSGHKRLVAYIKTVLSDDIEHQELKRYLSEKLPDYMVPGVYVFLDDFPLTHNGKIDKKALPAPETSFSRINNYVAPTTEEEKELVSVWEELLGIAKIGVEDNFFELGGDSIKAIQLVSKSKSLDIHYQVKDIFDYQTISGICSNLQLAFDTVTEEGLLSGEVPLHPIQHYFFEQDYKASNHYNQSLILTIPKSISIDRLAVCFLQLFHHHDALRLKYDFSLEGVEQRYSNFIGKPSACSVTSLSEIPDLCNSYQSELNIKEGDLLRALLIHTPHTEKKNRLFLTIHHLAIDGISWRVLLEDLEVLLSKEAIEGSTILPAKGTSYRQWTEKLQEYAVLPSTQLEYSYWKEVLSKYRPLPVDFSSDIETTYEQTHTIQTRLSRADTTSLTQEIHHAYGTEINDILLSALSKTMEGWISSSEFVIGLEGHGREELFRDVDLSRTIGWFTSLYPVCLSVPSSGTVSYEDLISRTKDSLREIPKKGINYPILRYLSEEEIREELSLQYEDLIFNYLGDFDHYNASENSLLSISNENTGEAFGLKNQNPNKIAINSIIVQGQLEINWSYDSHRYEENTIKTLSDKFDKILRSIIHHCKVLSDREKTPGDYGLPSKISYTNLVNFKQGRERLLNSKIEDIYPLTALQQGMLFHSLYNPEDTAYLVQFHCDLAGNFSKDSFLKSWKVLMDGHSTLRSCIYANELAIPVQCVYESMELPVQMYDYTSYSAGEKEVAIQSFLEKDKQTNFDFEKEPLFRITLFKVDSDTVRMVFTNHHILWDGWSFAKLMSNFIEVYQQMVNGTELTVLSTDNYRSHIDYINSQNRTEGLAYWGRYLSGIEQATYLPFTGNVSERNKTFGNSERTLLISKEVSNQINSFAEQNHITTSTVLQGTWSYLLSKYTGISAVTFGATISGRNSDVEGIADKVGLYINTIPVCSHIESQANIVDWLQELQRGHTIGREDHGYLSLLEIEKQSVVSSPCFDTLMVFENYPIENLDSTSFDLTIKNIESKENTNYTLSLCVFDTEEGISIKLTYNNTILPDDVVVMIEKHIYQLLSSITSGVKTLGELTYLGKEEKEELLTLFNNTEVSYPSDKTVIDLFRDQVKAFPEAIALEFEGATMSYRELEERSNQLAHYLIEQGIGKETLVPICIDRSLAMVVGILGIIKAGGAYVPIDPSYPQERIDFILQDTNASLVVTHSDVLHLFKENKLVKTSVLLDQGEQILQGQSVSIPEVKISPDQLIYVIYTSGTTGTPKGVLLTHTNVVRLFYNETSLFDFDHNDVWTLFHSFTFDFSVWEIYGALLFGGRLIIVPTQHTKDPELFSKLIVEGGVTVLNQTPTNFNGLQEYILNKKNISTIKYVIFGGEALHPIHLKRWKENYPLCKLINMYGITETTVHVTYKEIGDEEINKNQSNIGVPIPTLGVVVLDDDLQPVPKGVTGELHVMGAGVAKGYLNRTALTKEKFIDLDLVSGNKHRFYRSGDLARITHSGELEYHGRKDHQVKIRGYRIELGEIESLLEKITEIKQALVLAKETNGTNKQLVAYIVTETAIDEQEVKSCLSECLPGYMVPNFYVFLEKFPLTSNGKIDRKKLLSYTINNLSQEEKIAPRNKIEKAIAEIFKESLSINTIGINDDFFALGGDSIKVIQLISALNSKFDTIFSISEFYKKPTIEMLANLISEKDSSSDSVQELEELALKEIDEITSMVLNKHNSPNVISGIYPMTDIQFGMVYTANLMHEKGTPGIYHDQMVVQVGALDIDLMQQALDLLIEKHEILRTSLHLYTYEKPVQIVHKKSSSKIGYENIEGLNKKEQKKYINDFLIHERENKPFTANQSSLWRMNIFKIGADDSIFVFQCHHAIIDGWSDKSFRLELLETYFTLKKDKEYKPKKLLIGTKESVISDFIEQNNQSHKRFWVEELKGFQRLDVLGNTPYYSNKNKVYSRQFSERILEKCKQDNITPKALFISGYLYILKLLSPEEDITIGLVAHRRPMIEDGDKLLGCFLNTVPFRVQMNECLGESWLSFITAMESKLNAIKGKDRFSLLEISKLHGENSANPFFDIIFNYVDFQIINAYAQDKDMSETLEKIKESDFSDQSHAETNTFLDLTVSLTGGSVEVSITQNRELKSERSISDLLTYFDAFLNTYLESDNEKTNSVHILTKEEQQKIVYDFNDGDLLSNSKTGTILNLFENQVQETPEALAVFFDEETITYRELDEKTNQLARYLQNHGVGKNTLVPICIERSVEMIIAIIGVLKSGGAYVPIAPKYPQSRIKFILEDIDASIVLTQEIHHLKFTSNEVTIPTVFLDKWSDEIAEISSEKLETIVKEDQLAYIIYTSGTTGVPKGVKVLHGSLYNLIVHQSAYYSINEKERILLFSNYVFDASIEQIFISLANGASLFIANDSSILDPQKLESFIIENQLTHVDTTPSFLELLDTTKLKSVKRFVSGGESCSLQLAKKVAETYDFYNAYGPTETTITSIIHKYNNEDVMYIGKPIANTQIYILSEDLNIVPIGAVGELFIEGTGVSNGYLNQAELTQKSFIQSPFNEHSLLYRTGDLAKWSSDGVIEYIGRKDDQVKVRGYRIELKEIEYALNQIEQINQSIVLTHEKEKTGKQIIAYFTTNENISFKKIQKILSDKLPDYMIPRTYIELDSIPVTINGKVDKKALPKPNISNSLKEDYAAPSSDMEQQLAEIWKDLLEVEKVGVHDNFFELGGHSLLTVKLKNEVNSRLGIEVSIQQIFNTPTLEAYSNTIFNDINEEDYQISLDTEAVFSTPLRIEKKENILLTGGTGFVGIHLLKSLLETTNKKIFCLVRCETKEKGFTRIKEKMINNKIWQIYYEQRIEIVQGDLAKPMLGIELQEYLKLLENIDMVVHNATYMNHLTTYKDSKNINVEGVENVLHFCTLGVVKPLHFISTIDVFSSHNLNKDRVITELTSIDNEVHYNSEGYSSSKWIGEKLVKKASELGLPTTVHRLGLVLWDTIHHQYDSNQWLYQLAESCIQLGAYPFAFGDKSDYYTIHVDELSDNLCTYINNPSLEKKKNYNVLHHFSEGSKRLSDLLEMYFDTQKISLKKIGLKEWLKLAINKELPISWRLSEIREERIDDIIESDQNKQHYSLKYSNGKTNEVLNKKTIILQD
ncbi:amino acid adenylation domain-containing protein [Aquimarina hainanensis]